MSSSGLAPAIATTASQLRNGATTSRKLTTACLDRIAALNPRVNAFITVLADRALAEAETADRELAAGIDRGPLQGIPISLKDLIDLAGTPTTAASRLRQGDIAQRDAPIVSRLKHSGAVFVGKCNLHEFAYGTTSEDSAFGPVRHPLDLTRSAGGSSGGSGVAIATAMSLASVGTDTGGSIRIPAALCGIVGLKPSHGELPLSGIIPLSASLDHVGPMTRSVEDAWIVLRAMKSESGWRVRRKRTDLRQVRLGVPRSYFFDILDDEVRACFEERIKRLETAGAELEDVWIPHAADAPHIYLHIQAPEASSVHARTITEQADAYTPSVRWRLEAGRYLLAEDYIRARRGRLVLRREVDAAFETCQALVLPTVPIPAPPLGAAEVTAGGRKELVRSMMLRLTQLFNLTGHPAISIPAGITASGWPCGLQMVGRRDATEALLELAEACEQTGSDPITKT
jgi:aspartyl-tRNA(Asn)/glutamyl-tRNA(Gln) amidotransferase subunit A